jgi:hypothetical protein
MIDDLGRTPAPACSHRRRSAFIRGRKAVLSSWFSVPSGQGQLDCGLGTDLQRGGRLRKTNPIGRTNHAKRTQFPAAPGGTEPGGRGGKCAKRTQSGPRQAGLWPEQIVQNEPNSARVSGSRRPTLDQVQGGSTPSQLRQTKPNLGGLGHVGKRSHRVWADLAGKRNVRNEPNLAWRSQGRAGRGTRGVVQTNPIPSRQAQGRTVPPSALRPFPPGCTNKPNSRRAGRVGARSAVQTNPISDRRSQGRRPGLYKQSQFSPLGRGRWVGNPHPRAGRTHWRWPITGV